MTWERARSEEQIEYRINEIVDATSRLYEIHRLEEITFAMIAKEASFTRSNLYRYFKTKEEIFLELLKRDIAAWRNDILDGFSDGVVSAGGFSAIWVNLLLRHKSMVKLFTILYPLLEQNSSLEALTAFKQKSLEEFQLIIEFLTQILSLESVENANVFLFAQLALAIGTCPMTDLTPNQKEAMETVGMTTDPEYFKTIFAKSIELLLRGLANPGG